MDNKNKKEIKEMLKQSWLQQKEFMKELTGDENEKMDILDEYMNEKYTDEDNE